MTYAAPAAILGGEITSTTLPAILGLSAIVLIISAFIARFSRPASEKFVLNALPGTTVIYSLGSHDARRDARRARARARHLGSGETFAVLVRPDAFEVWGRGDTRARWRVDRAAAEIHPAWVLVRVRYWESATLFRAVRRPGVRVTDGAGTIHLIPAGPLERDNPVEAVLRALHS